MGGREVAGAYLRVAPHVARVAGSGVVGARRHHGDHRRVGRAGPAVGADGRHPHLVVAGGAGLEVDSGRAPGGDLGEGHLGGVPLQHRPGEGKRRVVTAAAGRGIHGNLGVGHRAVRVDVEPRRHLRHYLVGRGERGVSLHEVAVFHRLRTLPAVVGDRAESARGADAGDRVPRVGGGGDLHGASVGEPGEARQGDGTDRRQDALRHDRAARGLGQRNGVGDRREVGGEGVVGSGVVDRVGGGARLGDVHVVDGDQRGVVARVRLHVDRGGGVGVVDREVGGTAGQGLGAAAK